jgi:hypothetical protein
MRSHWLYISSKTNIIIIACFKLIIVIIIIKSSVEIDNNYCHYAILLILLRKAGFAISYAI